MEVRTITAPDGRTYRFGRRHPVARFPALNLKNYLIPGVTPPASVDYSAEAASALGQMYENDRLGDCVIAAVEHTEGVFSGNANPPALVLTDAQTTQFYSVACGYVPGDPNTDQGCDIQTVLAYWQNNGSPAGSQHKIAGWLAVDPTDLNEIKTALWLFENLFFGVDLPDAWVTPIPNASGFVWDAAGQPDLSNGHCFPAFGYSQNGNVLISTWAMTGWITPAAIAQYAAQSAQGELYAVISQDQIALKSQTAPNGLDWAALVADYNTMGGNLPAPAPSPAPVPPSPVPPAPPAPQPAPPAPAPSPAAYAPGSAQWLEAQLSPEAYAELVASFALAPPSWVEPLYPPLSLPWHPLMVVRRNERKF